MIESNQTPIFLGCARNSIDRLVDRIRNEPGSVTDKDLFLHVGDIIKDLVTAWHVRNLSDDEFESLTEEQVRWIMYSVLDYSFTWSLTPVDDEAVIPR